MHTCNCGSDETVAIITLQELIHDLAEEGKDVSSISRFFEVGEWLIAFEGIEKALSEFAIDAETLKKLRWLRTYFAD